MDDRKLQILLTTLNTGSFSKAAEKLNCTQSAITQMMNSMESELGCRILQRSHKGICLTEAGETLLPLFLEADTALNRLREEAQKVSEGKRIPIRIGAFSSISNHWLPKVLKEYQDLHPEVTFDIRVGTEVLRDWMISGKIDLAFGDAERCKGYRWYPLMEDPYYAVLPKNLVKEDKKKISLEEMVNYPFIMAPLINLGNYLPSAMVRQINVNCDDDTTLLSMVCQGLGVTIMPALSLENVSDKLAVLELETALTRELGVAVANSSSKAVRDFVQFLCI